MNNIDFSSRISALRSVGLAIGVASNLIPDRNAAISDVECLYWINRQRIAKGLPKLPGLDYHGFVGAVNDLANSGSGTTTSTWNIADAAAGGLTLSNGGMTATGAPNSTYRVIRTSSSKTSGKLYLEVRTNLVLNQPNQFGLASSGVNLSAIMGAANNFSAGENIYNGSASVSTGFSLFGLQPVDNFLLANEIVSMAIDFTASKIWLGFRGVWVAPGDPVAGTNPYFTFVPATVGPLFFGALFINTLNYSLTLQSDGSNQTYPPPTGFKAWDAP